MANAPNELPEDPLKNFYEYYRFKLGRNTPSDAQNTLPVVAALIAAVTFQAGVNPPGGVWQESKSNNTKETAGKSILCSNKAAYAFYLIANALAFSTSTSIIAFMVQGAPFRMEVLISICAMCFTYGSSIAAVQPKGAIHWEYVFLALAVPYLARLAVEFRKCIMRRK